MCAEKGVIYVYMPVIQILHCCTSSWEKKNNFPQLILSRYYIYFSSMRSFAFRKGIKGFLSLVSDFDKVVQNPKCDNYVWIITPPMMEKKSERRKQLFTN